MRIYAYIYIYTYTRAYATRQHTSAQNRFQDDRKIIAPPINWWPLALPLVIKDTGHQRKSVEVKATLQHKKVDIG